MRLRRAVALYEILAGASGLVVLYYLLANPYSLFLLVFALTLLCYSALALVAGILVWQDRYLGYRLGQVGEWLRLVRFATPWVSYYAFLGLDFNLGFQIYTQGIPGVGGPDTTGAGIWLAWNAVGIFQVQIARAPQFLGAGVNLVGVAVLATFGALIRRHREGSQALSSPSVADLEQPVTSKTL